eukprot:5187238-Prymnesium_polylepis.1
MRVIRPTDMRRFESIVEQAAQGSGATRPVHAGCSGSGTRTRSGSWAPGSELLASARGVLSPKICWPDFCSLERRRLELGERNGVET